MKRISLLLTALLMLVFSMVAQIKLVVYKSDGTEIELLASDVDSICFKGITVDTDDEDPTDKEDDPVKPDDDPVYDGTFVAKPFSVSATKTVTFSPGNLQYHAANDEWRFAQNQTDYIGGDNENISSTYNGWIDLFCWGTGNNPTNNSTDYNDYPTFVDWGVNKIGNYAPNTWRTLTCSEWYYLCYERPNYNKLIGVAQVNGVNGLIILPDGWTCPSGVTFKSGFHNNYGTQYYAKYQTFSASEWSKLEASGAVFFPAAGGRLGSNVFDVLYDGNYWSANEHSYYDADGLGFNSDEADMIYNYNRYFGLSVRLVQDNNNQTDDEDIEDDSEKDPIKPDDSTDSSLNANGYEYVDLGLPSGTLWATMNIGAESPEEYGYYFAWGETQTKTTYNWRSYELMTPGMSSWKGINKYTAADEQTIAVWYNSDGQFIGDNKTILELEDDVAHVNWGGDWRIPTKEEQDELLSECTWTWTINNGIKGYTVTGPNGNSIFLPATGYRYDSTIESRGYLGSYWGSTLYTDDSSIACSIEFASNNMVEGIYSERSFGLSVRPVLRVE